MSGDGTTKASTYRVVVVCPQPRHEFTVTVDADCDSPVERACATVFVLLQIGPGAVDDLPKLGYAQQAEAVRAWYADHTDLAPEVPIEVTTPDGASYRLVCDSFGYPQDAHEHADSP